MSDYPSVSVVIPTRDRAELLARSVRRVAEQDYRGTIECIVVFDQSEPSLPPIEGRKGFGLRAVTNDRTPGLAGARNAGVVAAEGDLVAFCDDDDEWFVDKLSRQVGLLRRQPDAEVVSCGIEVRYEDKSFDRLSPEPRVTFEELLESRRTDIHPSTFLIWRKALLDGIGLVDENLPGSYAEDYEWLLRAARRRPIETLRVPLVRVHWHRSSYFSERWQTIASALTYLLERYPEFRGNDRGFARISGQIALAHGAAGDRSSARRWAKKTFSANWRQPRTYMALAVSLGLPPQVLLRLAHLAGKGL